MRVRDRQAWNWLSRCHNFFETSDRREAHDKCCDVQNNERTFMNCVQISKKAQRNWSTAGKQAFPLKYEQIGNWFVACAEFGRKATEKSAGKKQPTQPTPEIKRKKMKKPELIGLKIDWFERLEHIILEYYTGFWMTVRSGLLSKRLLKIFVIFNVT